MGKMLMTEEIQAIHSELHALFDKLINHSEELIVSLSHGLYNESFDIMKELCEGHTKTAMKFETMALLLKEQASYLLSIASQKIELTFTGYCYLMRESLNGYYKIGHSVNPEMRRASLDILPNASIELIHVIPSNDHKRVEKDFHKWFRDKRVSGEWFNLNEEDVNFIMSHERMYYRE